MITVVAGTRPNFMKVAPVHRALSRRGFEVRLIHTGQHVDASMSEVFFRDLGLPSPAVRLHVGGARTPPCLTLREGTERPITVAAGTNVITGLDPLRGEQGVLSIASTTRALLIHNVDSSIEPIEGAWGADFLVQRALTE